MLEAAARNAAEVLKGRVGEREHRAFTEELISRLENARAPS